MQLLQHPAAVPQLRPGRRIVLSGEVISIHPASDPNGTWVRGVLLCSDGSRLAFVGSPHHRIRAGCGVRLSGFREEHTKHGLQLRVVECTEVRAPGTAEGVARYLAANVPGCGDARARRIVQVLGAGCLDGLLADPEKVRALYPGRIGEQLALGMAGLAREVARDGAARDLAVRLYSAGISYATVRRILNYFRSAEAAEIVLLRRPYRLIEVPGFSWKRADELAQRLGVPPDAPERGVAAVCAALDIAMREGHTAVPRSELLERARSLAGAAVTDDALVEAADDGEIVEDGGLFFRPSALEAEWTLGGHVARLLSMRKVLLEPQRTVARAALAEGGLFPEQERGVWIALENGLAVLSGRPGSGKTTTLRAFVRCCRALGWSVKIAAPTGKAASRAAEVAGAPAETIHRMLSGPPGDAGESTITADVLVVDETSMCSLELAVWLLGNVDPARTRSVLLVGDADQLPSVEHGAVLRDLLTSRRVPAVRLLEVHRQAAESRIVRNAHALLDGRPLMLNSTADFAFADVRRSGARQSARTETSIAHGAVLSEIAGRRRAGVPVEDIQVLSPMRRGPLGTDALNTLLQAALNPGGAPGPAIGGGARVRIGDRLLQVRNDYQVCDSGLFNGEQGIVTDVDLRAWTATVDFGLGRLLTLRGVQLLNLRLAWAMTVHRSQGSEWANVILLYHDSHGRLLDTRLLYTALTRARLRFALIGTRSALETTEARRRGPAHERHTALARQIETAAQAADLPYPC